MSYDVFGRTHQITFPTVNGSQRKMEMMYTNFGQWKGVRNPTSGTIWWQASNKADSAGRPKHLALGNGLWRGQMFDPMGRLERFYVVKPSGAQVVAGEIADVDMALEVLVHGDVVYDKVGNVKQRLDYVQLVEELFQYDSLDRLKSTQTSHMVAAISTTREYNYDVTSGFTSRNDIGTIVSNRAGRVETAGPRRYEYDYNGRVTDIVQEGAGGGAAVAALPIALTYNFMGQMKELTYNGGSVNVLYDADYQVARTMTNGVTQTSLLGLYERETSGGVSSTTLHRYFVPSPNGVVAEIHDRWTPALVLKGQPVQPASLESDTIYLHQDHLGTPVSATDETGNILQEMSFGPWGEQRGSSWLQSTPFVDTLDLSTGFTGHPMDRAAGMLNMGGRVYDTWLGRFMGPDPVVAMPLNSKSHNRYAYVENGPLNSVDPSGFAPDPIPSVHEVYPPEDPGGVPPQGPVGLAGGTYVSSAQCGGGFGACAKRFGRMVKRLFQKIGGGRGNGGGAAGDEGSSLSPGLAGGGQPLDLGEYGELPSGAPVVSTTGTGEALRATGKTLGQKMTPERSYRGEKMAAAHNQIVRSIEKGDVWSGGRPITAAELYHRAREEREEIYYPIRSLMGSGASDVPVFNADTAADTVTGSAAAAAGNVAVGNGNTLYAWSTRLVSWGNAPVPFGPALMYAVVAGATWKATTWGVSFLKAWNAASYAREPGNAAYCRGVSGCRVIHQGWDQFEAAGGHSPTSHELGYRQYWQGNSRMEGQFAY